MTEGSLLRKLQEVGFRKVVFSDTYSESWSYTLEPQSEEHGGRIALSDLGLAQPLVLP